METVFLLAIGGFGLAGSWWYGFYLVWRGSTALTARASHFLGVGVGLLAMFLCFNRLPYRFADFGTEHVITICVMAVFTILGFVEREKVLAVRAGMRKQPAVISPTGGGSAMVDRQALSGLWWMFRRMALGTVIWVSIMLVSFLAIGALVTANGRMDPLFFLQKQFEPRLHFSSGFNPSSVIFWLMSAMPALLPLLQLRLLRTLPLTTPQIVALVVGSPVLVSLCVGIAFSSVGYVLFPAASMASLGLSAGVTLIILMASVPIALRWGIGIGSYSAMLGLLMVAMVVPELLGAHFTLERVGLAVSASIVCSWFLSHRILARSSVAYRGAMIRMPGMPAPS